MSKDNFQCDSLSQDTVVADLGIVGLIDFGPYLSSTLLRTLEFCNPCSDTTSDEGFYEYRGALRTFLNIIEVSSRDDGTIILGVSQLPLKAPAPPDSPLYSLSEVLGWGCNV